MGIGYRPCDGNFQKLTSDAGGCLTSTSVLTDSTGVAESTFIDLLILITLEQPI